MKVIRGNTVGTTMKRPDFNQKDPNKSDYIRNNPIPWVTDADNGKVVVVENGKYELGIPMADGSVGTSETLVQRMHTADDKYGHNRVYYVKSSGAVETTETVVEIPEGYAIMVCAMPAPDSVYSDSAYSYFELDESGNIIPLTPPKAEENVLQTPLVVVTNNIARWEAIPGAASYKMLIGEPCKYHEVNGSFANSQNRLYDELSKGRGVVGRHCVTSSYTAPLDPDPEDFARGYKFDSIPQRMGNDVGRHPEWEGHIRVPPELNIPDDATEEELAFYESFAVSQRVAKTLITDDHEIVNRINCETPMSEKCVRLSKMNLGAADLMCMATVSGTKCCVLESIITYKVSAVGSGLQLFLRKGDSRILCFLLGYSNSCYSSIGTQTGPSAEYVITKSDWNKMVEGDTFKLTIEYYPETKLTVLYINEVEVTRLTLDNTADGIPDNAIIKATSEWKGELTLEEFGFTANDKEPTDEYSGDYNEVFDLSGYSSIPSWSYGTTDIGMVLSCSDAYNVIDFGTNKLAANVTYVRKKTASERRYGDRTYVKHSDTTYGPTSSSDHVPIRTAAGNMTCVTPDTAADDLCANVGYVKRIFNGANKAVSYGNYSTMITAFYNLAKDTYVVGQNVMIVTLNVPDLWVSSISDTKKSYAYTTDEAFVSAIQANGTVQVGYYLLSALETQKVDLTEYAKASDIEDGTIVAKQATYASGDTTLGTIEERLQKCLLIDDFKDGVLTTHSYDYGNSGSGA